MKVFYAKFDEWLWWSRFNETLVQSENYCHFDCRGVATADGMVAMVAMRVVQAMMVGCGNESKGDTQEIKKMLVVTMAEYILVVVSIFGAYV